MINEKRNHHFIARTEQLLHARSCDVSSKKINRFKVVNENGITLKKTNRKGIAIANNLSFNDLYCFHFLSQDEQYNFEDAFGHYESEINSLIKRVINPSKNDDLEKIYIDLFLYKVLGMLRNPFCIKRSLHMMKSVLNFLPADQLLLEMYQKIDTGKKPQAKHVCKSFGISEQEYTDWLKLLFMVLVVNIDGERNLLEEFARGMFCNKHNALNIFLFRFDNGKKTVFSDVGYTIIEDGSHLVFEFPLDHESYITFGFTNLEDFANVLGIENCVDLSQAIDLIKSKPKQINIKQVVNDSNRLKAYNLRMIEQAKEHVFSQSSKPFIL